MGRYTVLAYTTKCVFIANIPSIDALASRGGFAQRLFLAARFLCSFSRLSGFLRWLRSADTKEFTQVIYLPFIPQPLGLISMIILWYSAENDFGWD